MRFEFVVAAVGVFLGVAIFWSLATVAALRFFRIDLPFSLPFHLYERKNPNCLMRSKEGR